MQINKHCHVALSVLGGGGGGGDSKDYVIFRRYVVTECYKGVGGCLILTKIALRNILTAPYCFSFVT